MDAVLPDQRTFDLAELVCLLKCSNIHLRRAIREGRLQAGRVGRAYVVARAHALEFAEAEAARHRRPVVAQ